MRTGTRANCYFCGKPCDFWIPGPSMCESCREKAHKLHKYYCILNSNNKEAAKGCSRGVVRKEKHLQRTPRKSLNLICEDCGSIEYPNHNEGCMMGDIGWKKNKKKE